MDARFETTAEMDLSDIEVDGAIPEGLHGTMYRNGPADFRLAEHEFDGDGMMRSLTITPDGDVAFKSRYVATQKRSLEQGSDTPKVRGFGTQVGGGPLHNLSSDRERGNAANTSVMRHKDCLLALWEAGHPYQLDPGELSTVGTYDFEGQLGAKFPFSAHPRFDPATNELFNFGMHYGKHTEIVTYRLDRDGRLAVVAQTPIPHASFNHDFALTSRWCVYLVGPAQITLLPFLTGFESVGDSIKWKASEGTVVVLVARDGSETHQFEVDPWFQFHIGGAFDDGDDVVVDLVRFESWDSVAKPLKDFRHQTDGQEGNLWRYRISPNSKSVAGEELSDIGVEFPQYDQRLTAQPYENLYLAQHPGWIGTGGVVRVELGTGTIDKHEFADGHRPSEPLFCPRPGGSIDDGWVISWVWNSDREATDVTIFDADRIGAGPISTIRLPNAGVTFHGMWEPGT